MAYAREEDKRANQRDWYAKNQEKCIQKAREYRQSEKYKERRKDPIEREKRKLYMGLLIIQDLQIQEVLLYLNVSGLDLLKE